MPIKIHVSTTLVEFNRSGRKRMRTPQVFSSSVDKAIIHRG